VKWTVVVRCSVDTHEIDYPFIDLEGLLITTSLKHAM
jgi:hypothetical protein